ncbi:protein-disulfide reductase DsbD [Catenovulum sp. SX2]|uniref:protein-disulfide reductase DsbD n=1 Tax=Catenovulum sp. SX2 TaxID=3398614 RepID=UPI003F87B1A6
MKTLFVRSIYLFVCFFASANLALSAESEFLPVDKAFQYSYQQQGERVVIQFDVEHGYYLYQNRLSIKANGEKLTPHFSISPIIKQDEFFGEVAVFEEDFSIEFSTSAAQIQLQYQGCAKAGLCYPPQNKTLLLSSHDSVENLLVQEDELNEVIEQTNLANQGLIVTLISFFAIGVGLSFTPCVLPMAPILSSIITAKKQPNKKWDGLFLSIAYVFGMASFYSISGILIALLGAKFNLQLWMQTPIVSIVFAIVFIFFALTMIDVFTLKMPQKLESWLGANQQASSGYLTTYLTGGIASLALSPCVTAPMASLLVYIAATGDAVLGGLSLFVLSLGMSLPLLLLGAGMGNVLPKAGGWMIYVKYFFAASMLAMAVWLLARLLDSTFSVYLWSVFFIWLAIQLYGLANKFSQTKVHAYFVSALFLYLVSVINQPAVMIAAEVQQNQTEHTSSRLFSRFDSVRALSKQLEHAADQQIVIVDLYADWCASCKQMERDVFSLYQPTNREAGYQYYQLDLTDVDAQKQAKLNEWKVIAPPALVAIKNAQVIARKQGELDLLQFSTWLADLPN